LNPGKQSSAACYFTYRMAKGEPFQWMPLGSYPDMSLEDLREAAAAALKMKKDGKDPRHETAEERRRQAEATKKAKAAPTMKDACDLYLAYAADRANVKASTENWAKAVIARLILPEWGERLVAEVTKKEVNAWHKSPALRETPSQADAALRVLSKVFNLAIEEDWRTDNPATRLPKLVRGAAKVRERILNKAERKVLERTLRTLEAEQAIEPAAAGAIRVLLLSAMRLQECLSLRWDEIAWDEPTIDEKTQEEVPALTGWITKMDHKSSRRSGAKLVAITPQLGKILRAQPTRKGSPWVFPSPLTPEPGKELGHFIGLQKVWERLRERVTKDEAALVKAGKKKKAEVVSIEDVHLHDLRRTALSVTYGNEGQSIEALAKVAGHASTATTERIYAHLELEKLRTAAEKIATEIAADMDEDTDDHA
jgi:integrase